MKLRSIGKWIKQSFLFDADDVASPLRYQLLKRNIIVIMITITFVPLLSMALINYHQYQTSLKSEIVEPLRLLSNKTVHSFELFLEERLSTIRSIASMSSFADLSDRQKINRYYRILKKEFGGFVDLGIIDNNGIQVAYAGPYDLVGRDYSKQSWFHEVKVRGFFISDVFLGYREFPHIAIAVQQFQDNGLGWMLRATIDTKKFDSIIASIGLDSEGDVFLVNRSGVLQTQSKYYGNVLEPCELDLPLKNWGTQVVDITDRGGREMLLSFTNFRNHDYALVVVKPKSVILKSWYTLKSEMFFIFLGGVILIVLVVIRVANLLVNRIYVADQRRESAFRELENTQKLSSIGRLAAGVAHEINNPMAIINQKAGLMKDLLELNGGFKHHEKFQDLTNAILQSVDRCKNITHRLLGFARRMEVMVETLDINEVVKEVLGFLEKEALYRKVALELQLDEKIPQISSDKGQLQQVFLNILTNSLAAVEDEGRIIIRSRAEAPDRIAVSIEDNGCGMSPETLSHIFEPFFTTKKGYGTGLGLPITYGIIKKLGGDLKVQSTEGKGTIFTVTLKPNLQLTKENP
ncbi:two-component sensor histidine kinase [bacterium]|nr:two-component sensor histidine kinase [bacterium]